MKKTTYIKCMLPAFRQSRTKCRSSAKLSFFLFPGTFCRMFAAASAHYIICKCRQGRAGGQTILPCHST